MHCADLNECFDQIAAYFSGDMSGHFLLVNTENQDDLQAIRQRMESDSNITCLYASADCPEGGLPDADVTINRAASVSPCAVFGLSQALMLQSRPALAAKADEMLERSIRGRGMIVLDHCRDLLEEDIRRDLRNGRHILFADAPEASVTPLPRITLVRSEAECGLGKPLPDVKRLLARLERMTAEELIRYEELYVQTTLPAGIFRHSAYDIRASEGVYGALLKRWPDLNGSTRKEYGTEEQWILLSERMKASGTLAGVIAAEFGSSENLSAQIPDVTDAGDPDRSWLLWLGLKAFGAKNNRYLTFVLNHSKTAEDFEEHICMDLAEAKRTDPDFERMFAERRRLLDRMPENPGLIDRYCTAVGKYRPDAVYYLTDGSDAEIYHFLRYLSLYEYTDAELVAAAGHFSDALALYMEEFTFNEVNTRLSQADAGFRAELTRYFTAYKRQKLTNRIEPAFLQTVEDYAVSVPRPYNRLPARSAIVSKMDRKDTELFFFDALGVEYLSFILKKCDAYGMVPELSIGHCELPSITVQNKEFFQYFDEEHRNKIDELDEMKHHSQIYDYQKCEYPTHLLAELRLIDEQLRKIHSMLVQGRIRRALIISDHGASRLAVLYGKERDAVIPLDEPGEHSGRCCRADDDPKLPAAAYENGFAVLANYERFKGGRKANVEVHGGASLEEVLVPVIALTRKQAGVEMCFVDDGLIPFNPKADSELVLYAGIPLERPRLLVNGALLEGTHMEDRQHARFILPRKTFRRGDFRADVYDGEKNLGVSLTFTVKKKTGENTGMLI